MISLLTIYGDVLLAGSGLSCMPCCYLTFTLVLVSTLFLSVMVHKNNKYSWSSLTANLQLSDSMLCFVRVDIKISSCVIFLWYIYFIVFVVVVIIANQNRSRLLHLIQRLNIFRRLSSEAVKGLSLSLEGIDDVHGGDSLSASMLGVGD
jgi:hypothetical protein